MKNQILHSKLYNAITSNNISATSIILSKNKDINVLYKDGTFFEIAIFRECDGILKLLCQYFENKQFPQKDENYIDAKESLSKILKNAIDEEEEILSAMKKVLSPYLSTKDTKSEALEDEYSLGSIDYLDYSTEYSPKEILSVSDELPNNFTIRNKKLIRDDVNVSRHTGDLVDVNYQHQPNTTREIDHSVIGRYNLDDPSFANHRTSAPQIIDTFLGNSDTSTQEHAPEKNLSGDLDDNATDSIG